MADSFIIFKEGDIALGVYNLRMDMKLDTGRKNKEFVGTPRTKNLFIHRDYIGSG